MTIFGVDLGTFLLLFVCSALPFVVLALIVAVLYRRDRRRTPPEPAMPQRGPVNRSGRSVSSGTLPSSDPPRSETAPEGSATPPSKRRDPE